MGLDMYLTAEVYVSGYDFNDNKEKSDFNRIADAVNLKAFVSPESPSLTVDVTVAYWRKANAIHGWFVKNVQDGVDECQRSNVPREQLEELVAACGLVLANPGKAQELLPTQSGFFFGDTEYGEYYLQDLANTVKQISRVLEMPKNVSFYYRASW